MSTADVRGTLRRIRRRWSPAWRSVMRPPSNCFDAPPLAGRNLITSATSTFYLHGGLNYGLYHRRRRRQPSKTIRGQAKREIINTEQTHGLSLRRRVGPLPPPRAVGSLARALGLKPEIRQPSDRSRGVVCSLSRPPLSTLAQVVADRVKGALQPHRRRPRQAGDAYRRAGRRDRSEGGTLAELLSDPRSRIIAGAGGVVVPTGGWRHLVVSGPRCLRPEDRHARRGYMPFSRSRRAGWRASCEPYSSRNTKVDWWPVYDPKLIPRRVSVL